MSATKTSLPAFRTDRFEGAEALDALLPLRINRDPSEAGRDPGLWALEGIINPHLLDREGKPKRALIASNIPDVKIIENGIEKDISGGDIVAMLASARSNRLFLEYPHMDLTEAGRSTPLAPEVTPQAQFTEGVELDEGISIAFAHGAYREHFGVIANALKSLSPPDLGRMAWVGAEAAAVPAAA